MSRAMLSVPTVRLPLDNPPEGYWQECDTGVTVVVMNFKCTAFTSGCYTEAFAVVDYTRDILIDLDSRLLSFCVFPSLSPSHSEISIF